jgi:predicted nucleotidyltransferase
MPLALLRIVYAHNDDYTGILVFVKQLIAAYLFGSLAEETDHSLSDVDVALLFPHDTERATAVDVQLQIAAALEGLCRRPVDVGLPLESSSIRSPP